MQSCFGHELLRNASRPSIESWLTKWQNPKAKTVTWINVYSTPLMKDDHRLCGREAK